MALGVVTTQPQQGVWVAEWAALANAESGNAASIPVEATTRSVQVSGTFGAGGAVAIEGSNDGVTWAPLSNTFVATALSITAAAISDIAQNTRFIRPRVTAGDGTTNLKITLVAV
jgi:hypothetical protein